jgi:hypothetical protein
MSFRSINQKYLEPGSQALMVLGIVALCQPWSMFWHSYGITITLIGLIGFSVAIKIPREEEAESGARPVAGAEH